MFTNLSSMLSTGEQWNPSDLYKIDMPVALVEKKLRLLNRPRNYYNERDYYLLMNH